MVKLHPAAVEFGDTECCALRKATAELSHSEFINDFIERVQQTHPPYKVSILKEIFENTIRLAFIPREVHRSFYTTLAIKEKALLRLQENLILDCGHNFAKHLTALGEICAKMSCPPGFN